MTENSFKDGVAMLPQTRIQWIDTAKLIGIYLVILGHISMSYKEITNVIYSFHMPLFFFLSGLTAKRESVPTTFKKCVKSLLIPYVCLYLLNYLYFVVNGYLRHPEKIEEVGLLKPILGMIVGVGYETEISTNICVPLWFLAGLFCCKMLFSIIHNIGGKNENILQIVCSILFITVAYFLKINHLFIPFSLGSAFLAYPFFIVGNMFSTKFNAILTNGHSTKQNVVFFVIMLVALFVNILLMTINGRVDVNGISFGSNILLFYITAFVGIVFVALLSNFINLTDFFNTLARNTIVILAFHNIVSGWLIFPFKKLGMVDVADEKVILPVALAVVVALGSLLLNYIPIYIINRFFPWMLGRKRK